MGYEGPILLVGWFTPAPDPGREPWADYLRQMQERTEHAGVSYVDLSVVLPPADPRSRYYLDGLHPSAAGQPLIASSLVDLLAPRDEVAETSATTGSADPS